MKIPFFWFLLALFPKPQSDVSLNDAFRLYGKGDFKQAANLLKQITTTAPNEAEARIWLGKSYLKIRKWDDAVQEMERAVQLQPSNAQYHLWLGRACGRRASHSFFATALGWARRVVKEFEKARELAPEDIDVRFDLLEFYLEAPGIVGGGRNKAEAEVRAISKLTPAKGYSARATLFEKDKHWDLARKELMQATVDYPKNASVHKDMAGFLLERRDFEGALNYAKKALGLNGESKKARLLAAASQIKLNSDLDPALKTLQELAAGPLNDEDPAFEEIYYWLGEGYLAKGNKVKASEAFAFALSLNPDYTKAKERRSKLN
jgi:Tfp pilus assembly protein PilF